jgi:hypothetical protein
VSAQAEDTDRLDRLEAKVDLILGKIGQLEQCIAPVLANPGKLLAKIMLAGKG